MSIPDFTPQYLAWGPAKIMYLAYLAAGYDSDDIPPLLPNTKIKSKRGMTPTSIRQWRMRDPDWARAEAKTLEDPQWFHNKVALPLKLSNVDLKDLEYLFGLAGPWKGFQGKARELLLMELNLLEKREDATEVFRQIASNIRIIANQPTPALMIDATPVEKTPKEKVIDG